MIASLRDRIDWSDIDKTIRECACIAHDQGYKVILVIQTMQCYVVIPTLQLSAVSISVGIFVYGCYLFYVGKFVNL